MKLCFSVILHKIRKCSICYRFKWNSIFCFVMCTVRCHLQNRIYYLDPFGIIVFYSFADFLKVEHKSDFLSELS